MAAKKGPRPARSLISLLLLTGVIFGSIGLGVWLSDATWTPKLALDLEGGTQLILRADVDGGEALSEDDLNEAISIIRQRIDSSGVSEAEITSQGGQNIVVSLPGIPSQETKDLIRQSATMRFRPVLKQEISAAPAATATATGSATPTATTEPTSTSTASDAPEESEAQPTATASATATSTGGAAAAPTPSPSSSVTKPNPENQVISVVEATDLSAVDEATSAAFDALDCSDSDALKGGSEDDPLAPLATCSQDGIYKYLLGPTTIQGLSIDTAEAGLKQTASGAVTNEWVVNIEFDEIGTKYFSETTKTLVNLSSPQNQFAIVLDSLVVSAPGLDPTTVPNGINNGKAEISGSFTKESASTLANQLTFGRLPVTFETQSDEQISATLGTDQLEKGLIAGLIGMLLVVLFSVLQYRGLAVVTVASLLIASVLVYGALTILGWLMGYRLSLPGVAGIIVAIGVTADSFIVYFERIRDEVRDGRPLRLAVEYGWKRARRTIIASDAVNLIAAIVLYLLSVGGVRGFAFTLGLTTVIDLIIVFLFTHPMMELLIRTKFFGEGHKLSGLDPVNLGRKAPAYRGRGQVRSREERASGQTIAERRAAEQQAAGETKEDS